LWTIQWCSSNFQDGVISSLVSVWSLLLIT
jgi:hypothetical protein